MTSLCAAWPPSIRTASSRAYSFRTRCAPPSALQACARPNALPRLRFLLRCWALTRAPKQIPNYPEANLPTILVYKDHDIALQLVTLAQLGGLEGLGTRRDAQASRARARLCAAGSGRPREQPRVPVSTLSLTLRRTHTSDSPGLAVCTARGGEKLLQRALAKASGPARRPAANQLPAPTPVPSFRASCVVTLPSRTFPFAHTRRRMNFTCVIRLVPCRRHLLRRRTKRGRGVVLQRIAMRNSQTEQGLSPRDNQLSMPGVIGVVPHGAPAGVYSKRGACTHL